MLPTLPQAQFIAEIFIPERKRKHCRVKIAFAILYKLFTGHSWRQFPPDSVPKETVRHYWDKYFDKEKLENLMNELVAKDRLADNRDVEPTAGLIDSQSVESKNGGECIGYDGNKRVKGRKRHILSDVGGRVLAVIITAANESDVTTAYSLIEYIKKKYPRISLIWADQGYRGKFQRWSKRKHKIRIRLSRRKGSKKKRGFKLEKRRWVVERSFSWLENFGALKFENSKRVVNSYKWTYLAVILQMLRRQTEKT